ncbi:hypothetical protein E4P29_07670 [Rhodococcus sp. 1R11]|uniref:hypothetical protein n=1 Tax=Rhodococcus sp. 1R11 TaxID=2559614 RepID=UPI00107276AF|nr:hypothetical protein [Rhodococcus sp. 1R11]TFI44625.1 hypothetical protein E4P29_07670 [Rhodococcus sp. 1R11]
MLFLGLLLAAISAAMMTVATLQLSQVNEGHYLPVTIGKFAVRSPRNVTAIRVGAQAVAVASAWIVAVTVWDIPVNPAALALPAAALILPIAIPVLVITAQHNRRLTTSGI